jgi:radical SAM superfamily enzyme YgiQ (UPF0313 family)
VRLLDLCFSGRPVGDVEAAIRRFRPDVVGLSVRNLDSCDALRPVSYLPYVEQIIRGCTGAEVVLGGPAVSQSPVEMVRRLGCRFAVSGEGELAFPAMLRAMERGDDPASVPGVATPDGAAAARPAADLGLLVDPNPGRWLDLRRYAACDASFSLQTKRGCEFQCGYCNYPLLEGHGFRLYEPERVAAQVEAALRSGMRRVELVDSVWGFPQGHAIACCESMARVMRRGFSLVSLEMNPLACTPEMVDAMNLAGFTTVGITAESGSDTVLAGMKKGFASDDLVRAERNLRRLRARKMWIFMFGGLGETRESVRDTVRFIESLPHSDLVMATHGVRVYPRTALAERLVAEGTLDAGDDLLEPRFYYSPDVTPEMVNGALKESAFPWSNIVTLTDCGHPLAPLVQRAAACIGMRPPYWRGLPVINRARRIFRL